MRSAAAALVSAAIVLVFLAGCGSPPSDADRAAAADTGPALPAVPRGAPNPPPAQLKQATPAQVVALLGQPSFRRVDGIAEIFQYRDAVCTLDLFFYRDDPAAPLGRVEHVDARGPGGGPVATQACFERQQQARAQTRR